MDEVAQLLLEVEAQAVSSNERIVQKALQLWPFMSVEGQERFCMHCHYAENKDKWQLWLTQYTKLRQAAYSEKKRLRYVTLKSDANQGYLRLVRFEDAADQLRLRMKPYDPCNECKTIFNPYRKGPKCPTIRLLSANSQPVLLSA